MHWKRSLSSPDAHLLHAGIACGNVCGRGEGVVRLEIDHGPHRHAHGGQGVLAGVKLCVQCRLDTLPRLVAAPELVAKRFDDVVRGDADVRRSPLHHLRDRMQHARDSAHVKIGALGSPQSVEVAKQLVRAVDEMNDHTDGRLLLSQLFVPGPLPSTRS